MDTVSKSQFKAQLLGYLRQIERDKNPLIITHAGKPVARVLPYKEDPNKTLKSLRGTVIFYESPTETVGEKDWEILK